MKPGKGLHHVEFTCDVAAYTGGMAPKTEIAARPNTDKESALPMEAGLLRDWYKIPLFDCEPFIKAGRSLNSRV